VTWRLSILAIGCGCALATQAPSRPPLDDEGEIELRALPLAALRIDAAFAVRDERRVPLEVAAPRLLPERRERLVVRGRLAEGSYAGIVLVLEGGAELEVAAPFSIVRRRATVLTTRLSTKSTTAAIAAPAVLAVAGLCSSSADSSVTLFDDAALRATASIPTGSAPWGLAIDPVLGRAYVALSGADEIAVVDLASATELSRIRLSAGDEPRELLLTADRQLLVSANYGSGTVSFVDVQTLNETGRLRVGDGPSSLLGDRKVPRAYVFNLRSSSISIVDLAARSLVATVAADGPPLRGQLDRAGARLYVATPATADLVVYGLPQLTVQKRVYVGLGTTALKVDPDTDLLYVAQAAGRVAIFDPFSLIPIDFLDLPGAASYFAIEASRNQLFALLPERGTIAAIELTTKALSAEMDVGRLPRVVALDRERN
jgi:DNA-binding beta-propeller fold protein YncE